VAAKSSLNMQSISLRIFFCGLAFETGGSIPTISHSSSMLDSLALLYMQEIDSPRYSKQDACGNRDTLSTSDLGRQLAELPGAPNGGDMSRFNAQIERPLSYILHYWREGLAVRKISPFGGYACTGCGSTACCSLFLSGGRANTYRHRKI
jgi:hypothetical protein